MKPLNNRVHETYRLRRARGGRAGGGQQITVQYIESENEGTGVGGVAWGMEHG